MNWRYSKNLLIFVILLLLGSGANAAIAQTTTSAPQVEVVAPALNVREGPGVNYTIKMVVKAGHKFEVAGINSAKTWVQVTLADGSAGWVSALPAYTQVIGSLDKVAVTQTTPSPAPSAVPAAPGGGKLVFMSSSGGDIYLIKADGSGLQRLVQGGLDPAISPDGTQVAFSRWGPNEGIYLINVDGTNERQVHAAHQPKGVAWSPDGRQLIFTLPRGGRLEVTRECTISSESTSSAAHLPPDAYDIDRKTIEKDKQYKYCYSLPVKPAWQLRKLDLGSGQTQDLSSDYSSFGPTWDPRNPWRVVYSGEVSLVQLDLNLNTATSLNANNLDHTPAFSPDGTRLAVASKQGNEQWNIELINLDTGARAPLATTGKNVSPAWSPNGSQIAFLSNRNGPWEIWVMNADGSNQHSMVTLAGITLQYNFVDERSISWGR